MSKYKAYPEYKDSGVEWLGGVPKHWIICRLKNLATIKNGQDYKSVQADQGYPVMGSGGQFTFASKFMYNKASVLLGRKGTIDKPLFINEPFWTVDTMYYTELNEGVDAKYFYYLALTIQFSRYSTNTALPSMTQEHLSNYYFAVPKIQLERNQIAAFLDHETAKIDNLIENQRQLIELLKEKRQAVISHAVTKGLNPDVPMKDSGVEWLGEVPEHWDSTSLKHKTNIIDCKHITAEFSDTGIPVASIGEVKNWFVDLSTAKLTNEKYYGSLIDGGRKPLLGNIIYSRNATVGEAAIVGENMPPFAMGQDVCLIKTKENIIPEFILYFLKSSVITQQLNLAMIGSTFKRINVDDIRNFSIAIPPKDEQLSIVNVLMAKLQKYDQTVENAELLINYMQERRTALISAAVTGKIDVRGWVAPDTSDIEVLEEATA